MSTVIDPILPREGVLTARHQPLVPLLVASVLGILLDRYFPLSFTAWWLAAAGMLVVWLVLARWRNRHSAALVLVVYVLAFAGWHHTCWNLYRGDEFGRAVGLDMEPMCLEAVALDSVKLQRAGLPDPLNVIPQGDRCRLTVELKRVRNRTLWQPISGRATLTVDGHLLGVSAGDTLRLTVLAQRVPSAQNPGEFDGALHSRVRRELVRLSAPSPDCVTLLSRGSVFSWRRQLEALRQAFHQTLVQNISPENVGLATGLLVGAREQIEPEQTEQFFRTGTIHLLAISGVHVGILAYGFWFVMRTGLLSRRASIVAAIAFVSIYTLLTNAEPPVLRSAILVIVICIGRWLGRPSPPLNALAAGGLVVLAMNPTQFFQVGAQLSFLAVATLIYCGPLLIPKPPRDPLDRFLAQHAHPVWKAGRWLGSFTWRLFLTGACVWLVALPLTLYRFHLLSPSALWVNPLVWIPITIAMYAGFATLTLGWLVPPLGAVFGWICDVSLKLVDWGIVLGERAPLSYFWLPGPALWWVVGFYLALALYALLPAWRPSKRWAIALLTVWCLIGYATQERSPLRRLTQDEPQLALTFVAVGHGTAALLELPDGRTILYDAGHMGSPQGAANSISAVLWSRGITHLDMVVISHADADHYNALPELLERFSVGVIYVSPLMFDDRPPLGVQALKDAIDHSGVPLRLLMRGDRLALAALIHGEVLHPPRKGFYGSDNASSIVLDIGFDQRRILLPGDLESPGLDDVLAEAPLPCEVVMAPHHGSARSNPRGFAEWSTPAWVVISGSRARDATEVIDAYRSFGAEVLHTGHHGAIRLTLTPTTTKVQTWEQDRWIAREHHGRQP